MSRIVRLTEEFTDTSLPILRDDPILIAGSLALIEPAHPASTLAAGVPAQGIVVPNIAYKEAAAVLGVSPVQSALSPTVDIAGTWTAPLGLVERTTKGGLHGIVTRSAYSGSSAFYWRILMSSVLRDYFAANPAHHYFASVWGLVTRVSTSASSIAYTHMARASAHGQNVGAWLITMNGLWPSAITNADYNGGASLRDGARQENKNTAGALLINVGGMMGEPTEVSSNFSHANYGCFGREPVSGAGTGKDNAWPSWVWYRTYVEDLTVSGRSYSTVDTLDKALQTQHVLTTGGRYYGDSYTAPSTLP